MKKTFAVSILWAIAWLTACSPGKTAQERYPGLEGDWVGYLEESPSTRLITVLRAVKGDKGSYGVSVLSPMQTAQGFPGTLAAGKNGNLSFSFKDLNANYRAKLDASGTAMSGRWTQRGGKLSLELKKAETPFVFSRPQEPKPPFGYESVPLDFPNARAGIVLSGTLTYPKGGKAKAGIVLVSGSGAQNRDEELVGHKPFLVLADRLTKAGYAVLRYDDRGAGKSGGDFSSATTYDLIADAQAAVSALRASKDIKTPSCGILGHSEGGLIAALLSGGVAFAEANPGAPSVDFAVILAGPAFPGDTLLLQQSEAILKSQGQGDLVVTSARKANEKIYGIIKSKPLGPELKKELKRALLAMGVFGKSGEAQLKALMTPWFKTFLEIDPSPSIRSARVPVLALYGSRDIQVPSPANPDRMRADLASSRQSRSKVVVLDGLNHLFQKADKGTLDEYGTIEETMNERPIAIMIEWLDGIAGR